MSGVRSVWKVHEPPTNSYTNTPPEPPADEEWFGDPTHNQPPPSETEYPNKSFDTRGEVPSPSRKDVSDQEPEFSKRYTRPLSESYPVAEIAIRVPDNEEEKPNCSKSPPVEEEIV
jgi:hypothetical protein